MYTLFTSVGQTVSIVRWSYNVASDAGALPTMSTLRDSSEVSVDLSHMVAPQCSPSMLAAKEELG